MSLELPYHFSFCQWQWNMKLHAFLRLYSLRITDWLSKLYGFFLGIDNCPITAFDYVICIMPLYKDDTVMMLPSGT